MIERAYLLPHTCLPLLLRSRRERREPYSSVCDPTPIQFTLSRPLLPPLFLPSSFTPADLLFSQFICVHFSRASAGILAPSLSLTTRVPQESHSQGDHCCLYDYCYYLWSRTLTERMRRDRRCTTSRSRNSIRAHTQCGHQCLSVARLLQLIPRVVLFPNRPANLLPAPHPLAMHCAVPCLSHCRSVRERSLIRRREGAAGWMDGGSGRRRGRKGRGCTGERVQRQMAGVQVRGSAWWSGVCVLGREMFASSFCSFKRRSGHQVLSCS